MPPESNKLTLEGLVIRLWKYLRAVIKPFLAIIVGDIVFQLFGISRFYNLYDLSDPRYMIAFDKWVFGICIVYVIDEVLVRQYRRDKSLKRDGISSWRILFMDASLQLPYEERFVSFIYAVWQGIYVGFYKTFCWGAIFSFVLAGPGLLLGDLDYEHTRLALIRFGICLVLMLFTLLMMGTNRIEAERRIGEIRFMKYGAEYFQKWSDQCK